VSQPPGRRLEAPHRRASGPPRIVEKAAVLGYRTATAAISRVPVRLAEWAIGTAVQGSYLLWPAKRRFSNANFGHVLGLPPEDPRVRRLALRAYRAYARYLVELMRLPSMRPEVAAELLAEADADRLEQTWRAHGGPLIFVLGHIGNNEAIAAGIASRGWPISVIADDSSFPELFEHLRQTRAKWGVTLIPWRNLRQIYGVLRAGEMLGLLVDWGYRADGVPVRLGDAWTTLPSGPAVLAAKTGALIVPVAIRRRPDGRFHAELGETFTVPTAAPAEIARASQRIADELGASIQAAPEQWYSFKPLWPEDLAEQAALEARAGEMLGGSRGRGAAAATMSASASGDSGPAAGPPELVAS
jgi:KDO2-lipid IV(A) lauroyltransferase